jgi:hypothetical protein
VTQTINNSLSPVWNHTKVFVISDLTADLRFYVQDVDSGKDLLCGNRSLPFSSVVSQPASVVSRPASVVSRPASVVSRPASVVSRPASVVPQPASVVSRPAFLVSNRHPWYCNLRTLSLKSVQLCCAKTMI